MTGRVLVIEHQEDAPAGGVGRWLAESGMDAEIVRPENSLPRPDGWDAVVCLGSRESAYDDTVPWIAHERDFLSAVDAHGGRILGICFGAQQLATIFGGRVEKAPQPERGWIQVEGEEPFSGPWFAWHGDRIVAPAQARVHARTERAIQAFSLRGHLGVQFHPEIEAPLIDRWMTSPARVRALAEVGDDPQTVLSDTRRHAIEARRGADTLFRTFFSFM